MKKLWTFLCLGAIAAVPLFFSGCEKMDLAATNNRLDSTEKQLSYRTDSMKKYSIETAYENGWLTQTDLAYAMYYARGKVLTCNKSDWEKGRTEKIQEIGFVLAEECPALSEQVELDIKSCYYNTYYQEMHLEDVTFGEFAENISFRFVGSYNGTFVVTDEESLYWGYAGDVPPPVYIAGFIWNGSYAKDLFVFRFE